MKRSFFYQFSHWQHKYYHYYNLLVKFCFIYIFLLDVHFKISVLFCITFYINFLLFSCSRNISIYLDIQSRIQKAMVHFQITKRQSNRHDKDSNGIIILCSFSGSFIFTSKLRSIHYTLLIINDDYVDDDEDDKDNHLKWHCCFNRYMKDFGFLDRWWVFWWVVGANYTFHDQNYKKSSQPKKLHTQEKCSKYFKILSFA